MNRTPYQHRRFVPFTRRLRFLEDENVRKLRAIARTQRRVLELEREVAEQKKLNEKLVEQLSMCIQENDSIEVIAYVDPTSCRQGYSIRRASEGVIPDVCTKDITGRW